MEFSLRNRIRIAWGCTAAALVVLVGIASSGADAAVSTGSTESGIVSSVTDGDTLRLADGRRVRLLQIDAPELGTGECYSRAARTALLGLAPVGSRIGLETDPQLDQVDRYGRILRYVTRGSVNVNLALVQRGAAAPYFYRSERGRYATRLLAAAHAAKRAKRGLWGSSPATQLSPTEAVETGRCGPASTSPPPPAPQPTAPFAPPPPAPGGCDPNYAGACVPPPPPDLDCPDLRALGLALPVRVVGSDPHRLDGDRNGYGCE